MLRLIIDTNVGGLGLPQPTRSELCSHRAGQEKKDSDTGNAALVPGIRRHAEAAGAVGSLPAIARSCDVALNALAALIEPVEVHLLWRPQLPDPDDEMVHEAAINGRADALVTYNAPHFRAAAERFSVQLARPADIVREVIGS